MIFDGRPPYVAGIRARRPGGTPVVGSGFLISPRHILTCTHVITATAQKHLAPPERGSLEDPLPSGFGSAFAGLQIEVFIGLNPQQRAVARRAIYKHEDIYMDLALLELEKPVHGIAPPLLDKAEISASSCTYYRMHDGRIAKSELTDLKAVMRHHDDASDTSPSFIQHGHAAMEGNSGGPAIVERGGLHHLFGVAIIGGLGAATGVLATAFSVCRFLDAYGIVYRPPAPLPDCEDTAKLPSGVARRVDIPMGEDTLHFRAILSRQDSLIFRATRPLTAATARRLQKKALIDGAHHLPAHCHTASEAEALLTAASRQAGIALRLPRIEDVQDLRNASDGRYAASPFALPLSVEHFDRPAGPHLFGEWVTGSQGQPVAAIFEGNTFKIVDPQSIRRPPWEMAHLRLGLQPVLSSE